MTMKQLLSLLLTLNLSITLFCCSSDKSQVNKDAIGMENLAGLEFTQTERDTFLSTLMVLKGRYDTLRTIDLPNSVPVPLYFDPRIPGQDIRKGREK